jgi:chromatin assembly factor 1 subunit A
MPNGGRTPASLAIWRWEIKAKYRDWLPKGIREKADARLAERVEVGFSVSVIIVHNLKGVF